MPLLELYLGWVQLRGQPKRAEGDNERMGAVRSAPSACSAPRKPALPCLLCPFIYLLIYLFMAVLGLHCCVRGFSSCGERGLLFLVVRGLLIAVASLVAEHRLQVHGLQ